MKSEYAAFLLFPLSQALALAGFLQSFGALNLSSALGFAAGLLVDAVLLRVLLEGLGKEKAEQRLADMEFLRETEDYQKQLLQERQTSLEALRQELGGQLEELCGRLLEGETGALEQDMQQLQEALLRTRTRRWCRNPVANAVLSGKQEQCAAQQIAVDIAVQLPERTPVEPLDLCSVFANLLDNAIEASVALAPEQRRIQVRGRMNGAYLIVRVENAADRAYVRRQKRQGRGLGTQILAELARKYEGEYQTSYEDGKYAAVVALKAAGEGASC